MKFPRCLVPGVPAVLAALSTGCSGCDHGSAASSDGSTPAASSGSAGPSGGWLSRRDPTTASTGPTTQEAPMYPTPTREPDWDLDGADSARDYVRRYVLFTRRYGDSLACADIGPSRPQGPRRAVEVKNAPGCPNAGAVRDVFLVDVAADRLTVDDPSKRDPLALWPDGSKADGPPANPRPEVLAMRDWKSPIKDALGRALLVPVRVQGYGRGTYPVISLAGWHGAIQRNAPADVLKPLAEDLCKASGGTPLALMPAMDRSTLLRIRCPASTAWATL